MDKNKKNPVKMITRAINMNPKEPLNIIRRIRKRTAKKNHTPHTTQTRILTSCCVHSSSDIFSIC